MVTSVPEIDVISHYKLIKLQNRENSLRLKGVIAYLDSRFVLVCDSWESIQVVHIASYMNHVMVSVIGAVQQTIELSNNLLGK